VQKGPAAAHPRARNNSNTGSVNERKSGKSSYKHFLFTNASGKR
jgi:hypothetical protein